MNPLDEAGAAAFPGFGHHKQSLRRGINHRCAGDPIFREDVAAIVSGARDGRYPRGKEAGVPERLCVRTRIGVRVKGIHTVMLGGNINNVVDHSASSYAGDVERLSKDIAVNRLREELSEICGVDVRRRQDRLVGIHAGPLIVVAGGGDGYLSPNRKRGRKQGSDQECAADHSKAPSWTAAVGSIHSVWREAIARLAAKHQYATPTSIF